MPDLPSDMFPAFSIAPARYGCWVHHAAPALLGGIFCLNNVGNITTAYTNLGSEACRHAEGFCPGERC